MSRIFFYPDISKSDVDHIDTNETVSIIPEAYCTLEAIAVVGAVVAQGAANILTGD